MRNRQQTILFITNLILFFTGTGLFPLFPLYAARFGTSQTVIGIFLASLSGMNAVGALLASRSLERIPAKKLFIGVGAVGVPALFLLSQASVFWLALVAAALLWFSGGMVSALLNVLTGLSVEAEARGRAFSLLFVAASIGVVLGGTGVGALVSRLGYTPTFAIMAFIWAVIPALGLFLARTEGANNAATPGSTPAAATPPAAPGRAFYLLLASILAITAAVQMGNLAALLGMQAARFSAAAISSTTVVSGLIAIPVSLSAGTLSDRFGRHKLLLLSYFLVVFTVLPLAGAAHLWHFSAGIALLLVAMTVVRPVAAALATDLLEPAALQRGLPLLEASIMGVGVVSSAGTGYLLENFGSMLVAVLAATLALSGSATLALLSGRGGRPRLALGARLFSRPEPANQPGPC